MNITESLKEVSLMTECNDHNLAIRRIAEYVLFKHETILGINTLLRNIDALITLHKMYNCMTPALYEIRNDLKAQVFSFLSPEEEELFKNCL